MNASGWIQLALYLGILLLLTKPLGIYLFQVLEGGKTFLDPVVGPAERLTYRLLGIDRRREQGWKGYAVAMLLFSLATMLFTYLVLRMQHLLPLNPQGFGVVSAGNPTGGGVITPDLAFNTAASFTTNTNWQSYGGESTMSYFSQMVALAIHNFWLRRRRHRHRRGAGARHRPRDSATTRQLLGGSRPHPLTTCCFRSASSSRSSWCRRA